MNENQLLLKWWWWNRFFFLLVYMHFILIREAIFTIIYIHAQRTQHKTYRPSFLYIYRWLYEWFDEWCERIDAHMVWIGFAMLHFLDEMDFILFAPVFRQYALFFFSAILQSIPYTHIYLISIYGLYRVCLPTNQYDCFFSFIIMIIIHMKKFVWMCKTWHSKSEFWCDAHDDRYIKCRKYFLDWKKVDSHRIQVYENCIYVYRNAYIWEYNLYLNIFPSYRDASNSRWW